MIRYTPGEDVTKGHEDLLVNTVNVVGVNGKGVALNCRIAFPETIAPYRAACAERRLVPGTFQVLPLKSGQTLINFASKQHWRNPSKYEWVGSGFVYLAKFLQRDNNPFRSMAMPLPGCGNGQLDPNRVSQMLRIYLRLPVEAGLDLRVLAAPGKPIVDPIHFGGVGSRETPDHVLPVMTETASLLGEAGWVLRSGAAIGADSAFEQGAVAAGAPKQIFVTPKKAAPGYIVDIRDVHVRMAKNFHPSPAHLNDWSLPLMARNGNQVFGVDFTVPSNVLICWTPGGKAGGGTGQAIRLATCVGIPVIDLGAPEVAGITARDVVDLAREKVATFRAACGLPDFHSLDETRLLPTPG